MVVDQQKQMPGPRPGRYARLRLSVGRHPLDLLRVVVAGAVVLWCWQVALTPQVNPVESAILQEIQDLPGWSSPFWHAITLAGWWPGVLAAAAVTIYRGQVRLALTVTASAVAAGVLAMVLQAFVPARMLDAQTIGQVTSAPGGFSFPSVHAAVVAAMVTAGGPYLHRGLRDLGWVLVVLVCTADVFLGLHLPVGVFAGAFIGWGCGAVLHVVLGAPARATTEGAIRLALARAGLRADSVTEMHSPTWRPRVFALETPDHGRLTLTVVRRMHRRAGPTYKLRRMLASLETEGEPSLSTPRHEVEHEAYVTLLAERAGIRTLPVLLAGEFDHGAPFLVRRWVEGRWFADLSAEEIDDDLLDEMWHSVCTLATVSIAHHDLRAANFLVDTDGHPRITSFTFSRVGSRDFHGAQDLADTLVTMASAVGVRRALDSAERCLDRPQLEALLPRLQGLALHRTVRSQLREQGQLAGLREGLADRLDTGVPAFRSPVRPVTLLMLLTGGVAIYLLLPELSSMQSVVLSLARATWWWLVLTVVAGLLAIVTSAWCMFGATSRTLPIGRTIAVQLAAAFTGRTTVGGVGFFGINIVFLEKLGWRRAKAVSVVLLSRIGHGMISALGTIVGLFAIGRAVPVGSIHIPTGTDVWLVVGGVVVVLIGVVTSPIGRAKILRPANRLLHDILHDLGPIVRDPRRFAQMFGGALISLACSALGLVTTLEAFHPGVPVLPVMAVFIVASTLGQMAPTPGGLGAVEAAMVAGLTAIGIPGADAVAAVLACRLLTFWLPVIPGVAAFRLLQHHQVV